MSCVVCQKIKIPLQYAKDMFALSFRLSENLSDGEILIKQMKNNLFIVEYHVKNDYCLCDIKNNFSWSPVEPNFTFSIRQDIKDYIKLCNEHMLQSGHMPVWDTNSCFKHGFACIVCGYEASEEEAANIILK